VEPAFSFAKGKGGQMSFQFYTNAICQASKRAAAGIFVVGLLLIGFGYLVYILRDVFAILAAVLFVIAGVGCGITAVKIFLAQRRLDKLSSSGPDSYRKNVRIRVEEHYEQ
jgi:hypothetical protein